jgi:hypothetical protein
MKLTPDLPEAKKVKVFWNGQQLKMVLEADDVEGYVLMHLWKDGVPVVKNDELVVIRLDGDVRFDYD